MMANTTANLTLIQPTLTSLISVAKPTNQGQVIVNNSSSGFTTSTFISGITGPNGLVSGAVTLQGNGVTQSGNTFTFTGGSGGGISNLIINGNGAAPTTSSTIDFKAGSGISLELNNASSPNTVTISGTGTSGVGQISINGTNPVTGNLNFTTSGNGISLTSNGSNAVSFSNTGIVSIQSGGNTVTPVNGIVNFQAGSNISLTPSGNSITISATIPASVTSISVPGTSNIQSAISLQSSDNSVTISSPSSGVINLKTNIPTTFNNSWLIQGGTLQYAIGGGSVKVGSIFNSTFGMSTGCLFSAGSGVTIPLDGIQGVSATSNLQFNVDVLIGADNSTNTNDPIQFNVQPFALIGGNIQQLGNSISSSTVSMTSDAINAFQMTTPKTQLTGIVPTQYFLQITCMKGPVSPGKYGESYGILSVSISISIS